MHTYADVVAAELASAGIEYICGVPGSQSSVELIAAATKRGIRYVLCSNESSAAVMAGTYGVLRNRPGVCSTGLGPGAAAALLGVAHCWLERAPCLILTDRYSDAEFLRLRRQRLDQDRLFGPIVKTSIKLTTQQTVAALRQAIALSMECRPGPVHIDLPYDVTRSEVGEDALLGIQHVERDRDDRDRRRPEPHDLQAAADVIKAAQRPVIIAGLQVNRSGADAEQAFAAFAIHLGAPVFASLAAKGSLPEDHPLAAGTFRGAPAERLVLDKADLLIVVGFDDVELWAPPRWDYPAPVLLLDEMPYAEGVIQPHHQAVGSLAESLRALTQMTVRSKGWGPGDLETYRYARSHLLHPVGNGLMPGAVVRIARERLPANGIVTVDAGSHKLLAGDVWETRRQRGFLTSSGLGSMAVALPAALMAKMVEPQTPVVCLTGDGGLLMRLGDLEVAAREGLAVVVVVFNDGYLNMIKIRQDERGFERVGTRFRDSNFAAVARGLGFEAAQVDTERALDEALAQAFASGMPWLIDARINPEGYV